jgi:predicted secreted protein
MIWFAAWWLIMAAVLALIIARGIRIADEEEGTS